MPATEPRNASQRCRRAQNGFIMGRSFGPVTATVGIGHAARGGTDQRRLPRNRWMDSGAQIRFNRGVGQENAMTLIDSTARMWITASAAAFVGCGAAPPDSGGLRLDDDAGALADGGASEAGGPTGTVDRSQFGAACGLLPDGGTSVCPSSQSCVRFESMGNAPDQPGESGNCVPRPACSIVTCAAGFTCALEESFPINVVCAVAER